MDDYQDYRIFQDLSVLLDHADRLVLGPFNLSTLQYHALLLMDADDGWRLTDLSERLICERSTVTRLIDYLEGEGLVSRGADREDRRSQRVTLTQAGVERRERARAALARAITRRFGVLSQAELQQLLEFHQRLRNALREEIAPTNEDLSNQSLLNKKL